VEGQGLWKGKGTVERTGSDFGPKTLSQNPIFSMIRLGGLDGSSGSWTYVIFAFEVSFDFNPGVRGSVYGKPYLAASTAASGIITLFIQVRVKYE
jgi:hypothetical protein